MSRGKRQTWPCGACVITMPVLNDIMLHENEKHGATHEVQTRRPRKVKREKRDR